MNVNIGQIRIGQKVRHNEFGDGILLAELEGNYARIFFAGENGERIVLTDSLRPAADRHETILQNCIGNEIRNVKALLSYYSYYLPCMHNTTQMTGAKIDLLPHQIVLTHRIAENAPRRYLIADEVGLGKTIETALILRELISRGELQRALLVVPAGLVNNWDNELNGKFKLHFDVFGAKGDVFDRKSNAFEKHHRMIISIDTLKQESRIKRLLAAPSWDLVVFDEAHHLSAYADGKKIRKTQNYKLAEKLREHTRDLILLSATPHQGDAFRFLMLINLLDPTLFYSVDDMHKNRSRLNQVVFRRTKADACRPDGSTLFMRRDVHTESCLMSGEEEKFYSELREYIQDGFDLAKRKGNIGRGLGFVMAIFQKIAASSFYAVRKTLRNRLLALTIQEGLLCDSNLDIDGRDAAFAEAIRQIGINEQLTANTQEGRITIENILADKKQKILQTQKKEEELEYKLNSESNVTDSEENDVGFLSVELALPEERLRITKLLEMFPIEQETKVVKLLEALEKIWQANENERIVIFATYLGSVDFVAEAIQESFPQKGIVVLKGGDHDSKKSAENKFKKPNGPKVMICTAAGREGINLQYARILFNFDLPWNPMDIEQRIGRIHRYGQKDAAQAYNIVLSDTIEGKVFLMLEEKLTDIAKTLGKQNKEGVVTEDLRTQILGQLSERLKYNELYSQALSDPELKRTKEELEIALQQAKEAREVVSSLFQDLTGFSLDDYKPLEDISEEMNTLLTFYKTGLKLVGISVEKYSDQCYFVDHKQLITTDRQTALEDEKIDLLGLDYPPIVVMMNQYKELLPEEVGICVEINSEELETIISGVVSVWYVTINGKDDVRSYLIPLAVDLNGKRLPSWEKNVEKFYRYKTTNQRIENATELLTKRIEPMLRRELEHRNLLENSVGYRASLIGWIEVIEHSKKYTHHT